MIDEEKMRAAYAELRARVAYIENAMGLFVSEEELTQPKGDPTVRFELKGWHGENFVQKRYSQCSPEFLEALAKSLTWSVNNPPIDPVKLEKHRKYASGNRKDIALARTWARKLRADALIEAAARREHEEAEKAAALFGGDSEPALPAAPPTAVLFDEDGVIEDEDPLSDAEDEDDLFGSPT